MSREDHTYYFGEALATTYVDASTGAPDPMRNLKLKAAATLDALKAMYSRYDYIPSAQAIIPVNLLQYYIRTAPKRDSTSGYQALIKPYVKRGPDTFLPSHEVGKLREHHRKQMRKAKITDTRFERLIELSGEASYCQLLMDLYTSSDACENALFDVIADMHASMFPGFNCVDDALQGSHDAIIIGMLNSKEYRSETFLMGLTKQVISYIQTHWHDESQHARFGRLIDALARASTSYSDELMVLCRLQFYSNPTNTVAAYNYYQSLSLHSSSRASGAMSREATTVCKIAADAAHGAASVAYIGRLAKGLGISADVDLSCQTAFDLSKYSSRPTAEAMMAHIREQLGYHPQNKVWINYLGEMHRHGYGCDKDVEKAASYDRICAQLGDTAAIARLYPDGVPVHELFRLAKEEDWKGAYSALKALADGDPAKPMTIEAASYVEQCDRFGYGVIARHNTISTDWYRRRSASFHHAARFWGVGYHSLYTQSRLYLMIVGIHRMKYDVADHLTAASLGMWQPVTINAYIGYIERYMTMLSDPHERASWQFISERLTDMYTAPQVTSILTALNDHKPVNLRAGWDGHAISFTLFKIGEQVYLAYGNKGDRIDSTSSAIRFYKVGNIDKLSDQAWLDSLISCAHSQAYMESHDPAVEGLGKDFDLELVATIPRSEQNGDNCAVLFANISIVVDFMADVFHRLSSKHPEFFTLTQSIVMAAYTEVRTSLFKPFRFEARRMAVGGLCDLGDRKQRVKIEADKHLALMFQVTDGVFEKYPESSEVQHKQRQVLLREILIFVRSDNCPYNKDQISDLRDYISAKTSKYAPPVVAKAKPGLFSRFRTPKSTAVVVSNPLHRSTTPKQLPGVGLEDIFDGGCASPAASSVTMSEMGTPLSV